jgi:hypothetical protein
MSKFDKVLNEKSVDVKKVRNAVSDALLRSPALQTNLGGVVRLMNSGSDGIVLRYSDAKTEQEFLLTIKQN